MQKATIGAVLALAVVATLVGALATLTVTQTFSNTGTINAIGVGVYSNSACTTVLSSVSWGTLNPGDTPTQTIYVLNNGTIPETLTMTYGSWSSSSAESYITLTWNQQNTTLASGSVATAVLTLNVSSAISGVTSFSFDITITGTQ
jgi:predicted membrane channel-forming protein YqfA (hemolysin III family)